MLNAAQTTALAEVFFDLPAAKAQKPQRNPAIRQNLAQLASEAKSNNTVAIELLANLAARRDALGGNAAGILKAIYRDMGTGEHIRAEIRAQAHGLAELLERTVADGSILGVLPGSLRHIACEHSVKLGMPRPLSCQPRKQTEKLGNDRMLERNDLAPLFTSQPLKSFRGWAFHAAGEPGYLTIEPRMGEQFTVELKHLVEGTVASLKEGEKVCAVVGSERHLMPFVFERTRSGIRICCVDSAAAEDTRLKRICGKLAEVMHPQKVISTTIWGRLQNYTGNSCGALSYLLLRRLDGALRQHPGLDVEEFMQRDVLRWWSMDPDTQVRVVRGIRDQANRCAQPACPSR